MKREKRDNSLKKLVIFALASVAISMLVAIGVFIYFFASRGESRTTVVIPDLVGQTFGGFSLPDGIAVESEPIFSADVSEGEIISQFPAGGAKRKIAEGERYTVRVWVSLGREKKSIPDVLGFAYTEGAAALRTIGARIKIVSIYDDSAEPDIIIRTSPKVGEKIESGDTVTIFVSRNHTHAPVRVRNYTNMPLADAAMLIFSDGLAVGEIKYGTSGDEDEGIVISQSIAEGSIAFYGSKVDLTVVGKPKEALPQVGILPKNGETDGSN